VRASAIEKIGQRRVAKEGAGSPTTSSESFGTHVFTRSVMKKMLPKDVYHNVVNAMEGKEQIKPEFADSIAVAMKEWAIEHGATHYSHWFQPLTGATAEKHDAFIDLLSPDQVVERFSGKQLIQGEPDASSFPSGGLRSTYEARGYTGWDPTSPVFVWKAGDGVTLCIPSVFFSWTGDVLDSKIPILRSDKKIRDASLRLLKLTGIQASDVHSTLGMEQEYFVVDRALRDLRPDLIMAGRTVFGAESPKGQELQDHYFGTVKDRILGYMCHFEESALRLGIPLKTRHNEVAPAQHEVAPVFEKAARAVDHNILLMELMRQIALKHDLVCLLHEKPFQGLNGSGKHCNWSLATDRGINLLDPTDTPENNLHFLILLTAILNAVHKHAALLRASVASAGNDFRLGGHEAPPAIFSVYVGDELQRLIDSIEKKQPHVSYKKRKYDLGIELSHLTQDNTDRNRTSPFAFTGNKFEFRALGSSQSGAMFVAIMNVIVAESLHQMLNEIEKGKGANLIESAMPVIRKYLKASKDVRFSGDNYTQEWLKEAKMRKLPNIEKSFYAFDALKAETTIKAFEGVLTQQELESRYEIQVETYVNTLNIEANLMIDICRTQVLPAAVKQQKELAKSLSLCQKVGGRKLPKQLAQLKKLSNTIEETLKRLDALEDAQAKAIKQKSLKAKGKVFCEQVAPKGADLRETVDTLEKIVDDRLWLLPKYRELLFVM